MAKLWQILRWAVFALGAAWRLAVAARMCRRRDDPLAADPWLIRTLVPRIFRVTRADYRRPPALPELLDGPYIICANHRSHLDVPVMMSTLPLSIRMVGKPSLFEVPLLGRYLRAAGHLMARRKAEVLDASARLLAEGYSVGFFPEGTRTADDDRLGPFKPGAFALSMQTGRPILPVAVFGTGQVLPSGAFVPRRGPVGLRVGQLILPGADVDALGAAVRWALLDLLAQGPPPEMTGDRRAMERSE